METPAQGKVAIFLHSGDYDRMHQALSIAAASAASGRRVELFFFWWALERLLEGRLDEPDLPGHEAAAARFEERGLPTLRTLLEHVRALGGCRLYACSGSLAAVRGDLHGVERQVDQVVGWTTILQLTAGVTDRFYL